jgi:hypothetical protein
VSHSRALDLHCRSRTKAALDIAVEALRGIAGRARRHPFVRVSTEAAPIAEKALDRIETLIKEKEST